jgi:hypothetical protein
VKWFPSSVREDDAGVQRERNQVGTKVKLQEISNGLPFVIDDQEISFSQMNLDVKNIFTRCQGGG